MHHRDKHGKKTKMMHQSQHDEGILLDIEATDDDGEKIAVKLVRNDEQQLVLTTHRDGEEKVRIVADGPIGDLIASALASVELEDLLDDDDLARVQNAIASRKDAMPRMRIRREMVGGGAKSAKATIVKEIELPAHTGTHYDMSHHRDGGMDLPEILVPLGLFAMIGFIVYFSVKSRRDQRMAIIEQGPDAIKHLETPREPRNSMRQGYLYTAISLGLIAAGIADYFLDINGVAYLVGGLLGAGLGLLAYEHSKDKAQQADEQQPGEE